MSAHAKCSASGAYRWLVCTASPTIEARYADSHSSYAAEGTLAHALAEHCLMHDQPAAEVEGDYPEDMRQYIQEYVDYVEALPGMKYIEQRVDFSHIVPEGFGTSDVISLNGRVVDIIDLKYGKGKKVFASGPQGKLYAIGAMKDYGFIFDGVDTVRIHIVQPRLDWIDVHEMSLEELIAWGEEIKPIAFEAFHGPGKVVAGDHCDFCRARTDCRERASANLALAQMEFSTLEGSSPTPASDQITLEELGALLPRLPELIKWAGEMQDHALKLAAEGTPIPGHKLVEGRSNRYWVDDEAVAQRLRAEGYTDQQIFKPAELLGITAIEKLVGKKSTVFELAAKPAGKPVLVPLSDKRPELSVATAMADFGEPVNT